MKRITILALCFFIIVMISCGKKDKQQGLIKGDTLDFQNDSRVYKLAIIDSLGAELYVSAREGVMKVLKEHGCVEGKNLKISFWNIENNFGKAEAALKEAVSQNPDVILTNGTVPSKSAKKLYFDNPNIKFVFSVVVDPVGEGLIDGFGIPSKHNFTGVSHPVPVKSRLKFVKSLMPNVKTIGIIYSTLPQGVSYRKWVEDILKNDPEFNDLKVIFRAVELIPGEDGIRKMADNAIKYIIELNPKVDVFLGCNDLLASKPFYANNIAIYGTKPLIGTIIPDVMEGWGAVACIYPSSISMGMQSAYMIMKILKGAEISSIPAEEPKNSGFAFDLNKTKKFNITVPIEFIELAGKNIVNIKE